MFEVGKAYMFRIIEDGVEGDFYGEVASYEHPLIKLKDVDPVALQMEFLGETATVLKTAPQPGRIINVTSLNFVSALPMGTSDIGGG